MTLRSFQGRKGLWGWPTITYSTDEGSNSPDQSSCRARPVIPSSSFSNPSDVPGLCWKYYNHSFDMFYQEGLKNYLSKDSNKLSFTVKWEWNYIITKKMKKKNPNFSLTCRQCTFSSLLVFFLERICLNSVQFSHSVVSDSLQPHESQHARPPCPSPTPGVHSDSHPSSQWCHPAISSSVVPFSSCPQSLPASVFSNESTLRMR